MVPSRVRVKAYTARVSRDDDAWRVEVPEVGRVTRAGELAEVEGTARDLIADSDDVEPDSFDLALVIEFPDRASDRP
ncbi:hypothetical protein ACTD5D_34705 [Nocardia takedensis]|uniref:hypothetical protein n=1 Tax=Nocardia takedensis TaxID=259390 RepID=UPI0002F4846B|nr:hypothetical protein [Nocardia takedensis]